MYAVSLYDLTRQGGISFIPFSPLDQQLHFAFVVAASIEMTYEY